MSVGPLRDGRTQVRTRRRPRTVVVMGPFSHMVLGPRQAAKVSWQRQWQESGGRSLMRNIMLKKQRKRLNGNEAEMDLALLALLLLQSMLTVLRQGTRAGSAMRTRQVMAPRLYPTACTCSRVRRYAVALYALDCRYQSLVAISSPCAGCYSVDSWPGVSSAKRPPKPSSCTHPHK